MDDDDQPTAVFARPGDAAGYNFSPPIFLPPRTWRTRLQAAWRRLTWWRYTRATVVEIDESRRTVTLGLLRWSWLRWKWVRV